MQTHAHTIHIKCVNHIRSSCIIIYQKVFGPCSMTNVCTFDTVIAHYSYPLKEEWEVALNKWMLFPAECNYNMNSNLLQVLEWITLSSE